MYENQDMNGEQIRIEKQEIIARLDAIYEQIKTYPTPISGCDEQFNFLLTERNRLREILREL